MSRGGRLSSRWVRHAFWKYPLIAVAALAVIIVLAATVGLPAWPQASIAEAARQDPGGAVLAFTQELDGTAPSAMDAMEYGMGDPGQVFVLGPLRAASTWIGPGVVAAMATYSRADRAQRLAWASAYDKALGSITPQPGPGAGSAMTGLTGSPESARVGALQGDFGPVPAMVTADLQLAQTGYLEQYLLSVDPGHSFHLINIWLYDHPLMLDTAIRNGLTDDQWGMVKERGFAVGPWYLFLPAVIHVELPGGSTGQGFVLWNLAFAAFFLFAVPLVPGLRDLPRHLRLYRLMYRYPLPGELDHPANAPRGFDPPHGAAEWTEAGR